MSTTVSALDRPGWYERGGTLPRDPAYVTCEYDVADTGRLTSDQRKALLNDRAAGGWQLDHVDGVRYIFKRPKRDPAELRER
jgi:hypothetical protein